MRDKGHCDKGDACKYSHEEEDLKREKPSKGTVAVLSPSVCAAAKGTEDGLVWYIDSGSDEHLVGWPVLPSWCRPKVRAAAGARRTACPSVCAQAAYQSSLRGSSVDATPDGLDDAVAKQMKTKEEEDE